MSYPTYNNVSLDRLLAEVKVDLRLDYTNTEDPYLARYVLQGAKEMMTLLDVKQKTAYLDICDYVAILPCDFVQFNLADPLVFTFDGQPIQSGYYTYGWGVTYVNNSFIMNSPFSYQQGLVTPTINIQDGKIYFSNNVDAPQCAISYQAVNVNEQGVLLVPELNARPIVAYACYKYLRSIGGNYIDYQREWSKGKQDRKGKANLPDWFQMREADIIFNTLNFSY